MDISSFLGGSFFSQLDLLRVCMLMTIGKVDQQLVGQGANADEKICITFNESTKPLALNKTNLKRVAAVYSTDANQWIGKQLMVYRSVTTFGKETKLCVRVCGPTQAPPDVICDPQGNAVAFESPAPQQPTASATAAPTIPPQPTRVPTTHPVAPPQQSSPWDAQQNSPPDA